MNRDPSTQNISSGESGAQSEDRQMEQSNERNGSLEPNDSRNVTGAAGGGISSPGGSDQAEGGERWGGGQQQQQTPNAAGSSGGEVEFQPDSSIEQGGEVEFQPSGQMNQGDSAGGSSGGQQEQFSGQGGQGSGSGQFGGQIREHMEVIGADGSHVGTVDSVEGDKIKLTKADSGAQIEGAQGSHEGHHHYLPIGLVAGVEGNQVRLSASGANAYGMESES